MEKDVWRKKVNAECGDVCKFAVGFLSFERSAAAALTVYEVTVSLSLGLRPV